MTNDVPGKVAKLLVHGARVARTIRPECRIRLAGTLGIRWVLGGRVVYDVNRRSG